ncbi:hypothetical protein DFH07DRAFT_774489 [Mycena maculata]|uniref:Uncharacterized protein n=1 Tax=Mycena maculata TaxID=230809 RepID=A0AAD7NB08_9AGAR|nr:hypothetical protein DFH07DRAFT_774489 [Mycena maculata]
MWYDTVGELRRATAGARTARGVGEVVTGEKGNGESDEDGESERGVFPSEILLLLTRRTCATSQGIGTPLVRRLAEEYSTEVIGDEATLEVKSAPHTDNKNGNIQRWWTSALRRKISSSDSSSTQSTSTEELRHVLGRALLFQELAMGEDWVVREF